MFLGIEVRTVTGQEQDLQPLATCRQGALRRRAGVAGAARTKMMSLPIAHAGHQSGEIAREAPSPAVLGALLIRLRPSASTLPNTVTRRLVRQLARLAASPRDARSG